MFQHFWDSYFFIQISEERNQSLLITLLNVYDRFTFTYSLQSSNPLLHSCSSNPIHRSWKWEEKSLGNLKKIRKDDGIYSRKLGGNFSTTRTAIWSAISRRNEATRCWNGTVRMEICGSKVGRRGVTLSCKGEQRSRYGIVARLFFFLFRSRERSSLATSFSLFGGAESCFKAWYRKDGFVQLDSDYLFLTWKRIVEEEELYVELFETFEKYIYIHFPLFTLPRKRRFTKKREKQRWKWFLSPFLAPFHRSRRIVHFTLLPDKKESVRYYINCLLWLFQFEDR